MRLLIMCSFSILASLTLLHAQTPLPLAGLNPEVLPGFVDSAVKPAQRLEPPLQPATLPERPTNPGVMSTQPLLARDVFDPPSPVVLLKVRSDSHQTPGKPVSNKITVVNTSTAVAKNVVVRIPYPVGITGITKQEPAADNALEFQKPMKPKDMLWKFSTLARGEQKTIELWYMPADGVKSVKLAAHVSFEFGVEVETNIDKPKLVIRKTATPEVALGELTNVRVEVINTGNVTIANARLVESVSIGAEFRSDRSSEAGTSPSQRIWQLGQILPRQTKIVEYQLMSKAGGELVSTSVAASADATTPVQSEKAETRTKVLTPGLKLDFTGPAEVAANQPGEYKAIVSNSGTLPLSNVVLNMVIPSDCDIVKFTNRGRKTSREQINWQLPVLPAGESREYRIQVMAETSGRKQIKASIQDSRANLTDTKAIPTVFQGRADLTWAPTFDPVVVSNGRQGKITIKVSNQGGETEKNMQVRMDIPDKVKIVQAVPNAFEISGNEMIFKSRPLAPGQSDTFVITYEAKQAGTAYFRMRLQADSLGERPLIKQQAVEINNSR